MDPVSLGSPRYRRSCPRGDAPHRRGSHGRDGFPAHAGMDPLLRLGEYLLHLVSPPTRGWTPPRLQHVTGFPAHGTDRVLDRLHPADYAGFPAHAGMDLHRAAGCDVRPAEVSPPTRGWTPGDCTHHPRGIRRFPRPRGDGPDSPNRATGARHGFPAHAGMDLTKGVTLDVATAGFPAHAGMDREDRGNPCSGMRRFPRPRGDGPGRAALAARKIEVSPPTRGWTLLPVLELCGFYARHGFPAHAGMDPKLPPHGTPEETVSPPTRGWTRRSMLREVCDTELGFPAHAGMDPSTEAPYVRSP